MEIPQSPIEVTWLFEDEQMLILYGIYTDPWTWDDFDASLQYDRELTRSAGGRAVYRVLDLTQTHFVPPGATRHLRLAAEQFAHANHLTILVATDPLLRAMGTLMMRLFPRSLSYMRHAAKIEEASALIERLTRNELI